MDKTAHHVAFQTVHGVFYLRKISILIVLQLGSQLLVEMTSIFRNSLKHLSHSERVLFYYHSEIQAYDDIILRMIREPL